MYAEVEIRGPAIEHAVVVPDSAVLRTGERNLVFVDLGDGRYAPAEVRLGVEGGDRTVQILSGLEPGDRVVTQAQFLLDSESRIQEAIEKFRARSAERRTVDGEGDVDGPDSGHTH